VIAIWRGERYLLRKRVFAVVSRQFLIDSKLSTVICAPVYSLGTEDGLTHESTFIASLHCDELISLPKTALTRYVGSIAPAKMRAIDFALGVALDLGIELG
jgi:mRNA interferase MazF